MVAVEAQSLAYALEFGAVDMKEVRAWADTRLLRDATQSEELLSLSLEGSISGAISVLHSLGDDADMKSVGLLAYRYLGLALKEGRLSHEQVAQAVVRLAREASAPSPEAEGDSWHFDDAFYLASQGIWGSTAEVKRELEEHLEKYTL